jgi:hypothetical protein
MQTVFGTHTASLEVIQVSMQPVARSHVPPGFKAISLASMTTWAQTWRPQEQAHSGLSPLYTGKYSSVLRIPRLSYYTHFAAKDQLDCLSSDGQQIHPLQSTFSSIRIRTLGFQEVSDTIPSQPSDLRRSHIPPNGAHSRSI